VAAGPADHPGPARSAAPRLVVVEDTDALAEEASSIVLAGMREALRQRGAAHVVLAGGGTPRKTHVLLARAIVEQKLPVNALSWWFGDERWVVRSDPQSNEGMARETLLGPVGAPEASIHSWGAGNGEPLECARRYAEAVRGAMAGGGPDVVMLGIGPDGHTASLFPGSTMYLPDGREVPVGPHGEGGFTAAAIRGGNAPGWRLTLSPGVLSSAANVVFLVSGANKAGPVRRAANGDPATPAAWIRGRSTTFLLTRDAAGSADTGYGPEIRHA
jgi:6-phosphogluconolactonase